ncbi:MAG: hypothetical protein A2033_16000 [Bacteroidetes bacterium GWA2_31_9]|nr:MAG: hypothetical protein A2033_16000 [Bacteroidetes bacterium GWA2_31_9]
MKNILRINDGLNITIDELPFFGGKAAQQAMSKKDGFPVLNAFAISSLIYPEQVWFEKIKTYNTNQILNELNQVILNSGINLSDELHLLNANSFSVRSSATIEDIPEASFAGSFLTRLFVKPQEVPFAIYEVWKSGLEERVIKYSKDRGLTDKQIKVAVLIQPMINSHFAGVAFSHPIGYPEDNHIFISIVKGIGEPLVSGSVMGQNFWVERLSYLLKKYENSNDLHLLSHYMSDIAMMVEKLELIRNCPQDIEFCFDQNFNLILLQNRPITKAK